MAGAFTIKAQLQVAAAVAAVMTTPERRVLLTTTDRERVLATLRDQMRWLPELRVTEQIEGVMVERAGEETV